MRPADLAGAHVLVTGGAGFIGSHVVEALVDEDVASITVVDTLVHGSRANLADALDDPRVRMQVDDIRDAEAMTYLLRDVDVVLHLASLGVEHGLRYPVENHHVNASGTLGLLEAARAAGVRRFVHVSSSDVFGAAHYLPMDERHPTWPETVYGAAKLAGEAYARAAFRTHGLPTVVLRPFSTYGPRSHHEGDGGETLSRAVVRMLAGERPTVLGDGGRTRDLMYVTDTARAIVLAGAVPGIEGETLNVGTGTEVSVLDGIDAITRLLGRPDLPPLHLGTRPGQIERLRSDPRRFAELTGFAPQVALEDGIGRLVEWSSRAAAPALAGSVRVG